MKARIVKALHNSLQYLCPLLKVTSQVKEVCRRVIKVDVEQIFITKIETNHTILTKMSKNKKVLHKEEKYPKLQDFHRTIRAISHLSSVFHPFQVLTRILKENYNYRLSEKDQVYLQYKVQVQIIAQKSNHLCTLIEVRVQIRKILHFQTLDRSMRIWLNKTKIMAK